jgi:hypothetical protein
MKVLYFIVLLTPIAVFSSKAQSSSQQPQVTATKEETTSSKDEVGKAPTGGNSDNYGWGNRISFIAGGGPSFITTSLYNDPVVNKATNTVIIEKAGVLKPNLTLGIVYTPYVSDVFRDVNVMAKDGKTVEKKTIIEYYPKGITYALFINPINLSSLADKSLSTSIDLGLGLGYRAGSFSVLGTMDFFSVRQPRDYFIEQYQDNKQIYTVNGQIQTAFDTNDNAIFKSKIAFALGLKFCYTFDIVRSFYKAAGDVPK